MADLSYSLEGRPAGELSKFRSYKKYIIVAAVIGVVLTLVIIIVGVLVGLRTSTQKDIMHFSYDMDENTKEEMTSDPNKNMVMYHVTSKEYKAWLINDFNRDIQVMKIQTESYTNCVLMPLNRTMAREPSTIKPSTGDEMFNDTHMNVMTYRSADTPVADLTLMSQTAKDTCNGISTYWLFPSCMGSDSVARRPKRFWGLVIGGVQIAIGLAQLVVSIVK